MSEFGFEFDQESFNEFLAESGELLENLEPVAVNIEKEPHNLNYINEAFRILHSIKGMSSFFSITSVKITAHKLEDLLSEVKDGKKIISVDIIEALFKGLDILKRLFVEINSGILHPELNDADNQFIKKIDEFKTAGSSFEKILNEYISYTRTKLENISETNKDLIENSEFKQIFDKTVELENQLLIDKEHKSKFETQHKIITSTGKIPPDFIYKNVIIGKPLSEFEILCRKITNQQLLEVDEVSAALLTESFQTYKQLVETNELYELEEITRNMSFEFDTFSESTGINYILTQSLLEYIYKIYDLIKKIEEPEKRGKTDIETDLSSAAVKTGIKKTFRVEEEKVDDFMNYVGELITIQEAYNYLQKRLQLEAIKNEYLNELKNTNIAFDILSNNLQKSLLDIRKLPVSVVTKKYTAMVRKLASELNKKVELKITNDSIRCDKSIIEMLEIPLTHIIRNSVDHGIEDIATRKKIGKNETGIIEIDIAADEKYINIMIKDDGRGLDPEKIKNKIIEKGLANAEEVESMAETEIYNFIFQSGFSTAEKVTDVSGRGVGMDAALSSIKGVGGLINIASESNKGLEVMLKLPLVQTVIVIDGLVIRINKEYFVVPIEKIVESVPFNSAELSTVKNASEMIKLRNKLFPLFRLNKILRLTEDNCGDNKVLIIINDESNSFAVMVDEICEQKKFVLKSLGKSLKNVSYFLGSAVMGNGKLCLVLNVSAIRMNNER